MDSSLLTAVAIGTRRRLTGHGDLVQVMDLCTGGDFFDFLSYRGSVTEDEARALFLQVPPRDSRRVEPNGALCAPLTVPPARPTRVEPNGGA